MAGGYFEQLFIPSCYLPSPPPIHQPPMAQAASTGKPSPPSSQFDPDPAIILNNPDPASARWQPRSFNRETLSTDHVAQGSGRVAGKVLTVDL